MTGGLQPLLQARLLWTEPAFMSYTLHIDGQPKNLTLFAYPLPSGGLPATPPRLYHTKSLPPCCCSLYMGMNKVMLQGATLALLQWPIIAHAPNPRIHHGHARQPVPG
jgi:hypothetical protein